MNEEAPAGALGEPGEPDPIAEGGAVAIEVDRDKLGVALRRNTAYVAVYGSLVAAVLAAIVVLAVTGIGRYLTYVLLGLLLLIFLASLVMGLWLRRRVRGFLSLTEPFITVGRDGIAFAGIPRVGWGDVLGVIYGDSSAALHQGGRFARWSRNLVYRAGGAQVFLNVGIDRPKRYKAASTGALVRYLSAWGDLGGVLVHLDTALGEPQLARLRAALRSATALADVRYVESTDTQRLARAAASMASGRRMRPDA